MTNRRRKFAVKEHEEYGYIGLAPTWMADHQSDPLQGMGVAHDILEHGSSDKVEWQGLGGTIYIRGCTGYFQMSRGNPDPAANIGGEFTQLYRLWEGADIPDPGHTRRLSDSQAEELIQECVTVGCRQLLEEELEPEARQWTRPEQKRRMVGWMRKGYRAAVRRWAGVDAYMLMETFRAIEKAVDKVLSNAEGYEGATAVVVFNVTNGSAWAEITEQEYDY